MVYTATLTLDGACHLELTQWIEPVSTGHPYPRGNHRGLYRFALAVDDVRASYETLAESAAYVIEAPRYVPLPGTPLGGLWISFLKDPDGVVVELIERPRSSYGALRR